MATSGERSRAGCRWFLMTILALVFGGTIGGFILPYLFPIPSNLIVPLAVALAILAAIVWPFVGITIWHIKETFQRVFPDTVLYEWLTQGRKPGYELWRQAIHTNADGEEETLETLERRYANGDVLNENEIVALHSAWKSYIEAGGYSYIPLSIPLTLLDRTMNRAVVQNYMEESELDVMKRHMAQLNRGESLSVSEKDALDAASWKYRVFVLEELSDDERELLNSVQLFNPQNMSESDRTKASENDLDLLDMLFSGNRW